MNLFLNLKKICALTFLAVLISLHTFAVDYYVDANAQSPGNGTSGSPWTNLDQVNQKTFVRGDRLLFKKGCTWLGQLRLQNSGTSTARVTVDAYPDESTDPLPIINGNGISDQSTQSSTHAGATVLIRNSSNWIIRNLDIRNTSSTQGFRQGIKIVAEDSQGSTSGYHVQNITIEHVKVQQVFGTYNNLYQGGKSTGGINLFFFRPAGTYASTNYAKSRFSNILIRESAIQDINRVGIFVNSTTNINADTGFGSVFPVNGLVIRRNVIKNCTGDGVIVRFAEGALVESNYVNNIHTGSEVEGKTNYVGHGVALWCRSANNTKFQFNEVCNTQGGLKDGFAFDADYKSTNTFIQYNYSHDNEGGFVLFMKNDQTEVPGTVVRYNISHNDGLAANRIFRFSRYEAAFQYDATAQIYNNTIYFNDQENGNPVIISDNISPKTKFINNVFIKPNGSAGIIKFNSIEENAVWQNNHFENFTNIPSGSPNINNSSGASGLNETLGTALNLYNIPGSNFTIIGTLTAGGGNNLGTKLDAYKLNQNTITYKKGRDISTTPDVISTGNVRDFYNIAVTSGTLPNKGAHNGCYNCSNLANTDFGNSFMTLLPEADVENAMVLFPNPVARKLFISNLPQGSHKVEILDTNGRKVVITTMDNASLDTSELPSGHYILVFPNNREMKGFHFIKSRQ